jgi:transcriptional regulator with XRE-family HTH domain
MKPKQQLGLRIKRLRGRLELTQEALAEEAGINTKYLSSIESGRENPTLDILFNLAKSLKVEPWEMFFFEADGVDAKALKAKITAALSNVKDEEQLRLITRLLQAALH